MIRRLTPALLVLALAGCASTIDAPIPLSEPSQARLDESLAALALPKRAEAPARPAGQGAEPLAALARANGAARQGPSEEAFEGARQIYRYQPGAIYELYAHPDFISAILLEPGERLIDIAAGDTRSWMVSQSLTETQAQGRAIVLLKPHARGLRTNIVLITDRRVYLLEAIAQEGAYSAQIAWSYPRAREPAPQAIAPARVSSVYRIRTIRGRAPVWVPERVHDDGRRTTIEFSPEVEAADLPPLFVITPEGAELVNYQVVGTRYIVDRVFETAELRHGARAPVIVRIERRAGAHTP